eukprot:CAMPEP_0197233230 /NCGR_PEP_ID=MMETSP1429-20130617/1357_1 /TAXON_ID=49237 /ORGANISM="Chaetoceros  sp., Strain UNC1202" /LENGTH=418 /DNA_ID=CAMNT_0042691445 /DNA_START=41 /DNA_END=1297 /DNA_ORIENTATION=+
MSFVSQFGEKFLNPSADAEVSPAEALEGKDHVLMYFSAHWCPPCLRFTPVLIELYKKLNQEKNFEIIFCSFDKDEKEYKEYTADMPWLCMPFNAKETKVLAGKYNADGIPHLVIADGEGKVITEHGYTEVMEDNEGTNFPWKYKSFKEVWPEQILVSKGDTDTFLASSEISDKYLMLYFSAHWCPPCRAFTPKLSEAYTKLKAIRNDFELVFVSSDKTDEDFNEYFNTMSFCALPHEHREAKAALSRKFGVQGIPMLTMLGPVGDDGERPLINANVRSFIESGEFDEFPFDKKNFGDVDRADEINEVKCLIVLGENCDDDEGDEIKAVVKDVAAKLAEKKKEDGGDDFNVHWALNPKGMAPRIRRLAGLPPVEKLEDPVMIILDLPDQGGYYKSDVTDITSKTLMEFIENPGARFQLG